MQDDLGAQKDSPPSRIASPYTATGPTGELVLYCGDLNFTRGGVERVVTGQIEFAFDPKPHVRAHIESPHVDLDPFFNGDGDDEPTVAIPAAALLSPSAQETLPSRPAGSSWNTEVRSLNKLDAGQVSHAETFLIHALGGFKLSPSPEPVTDGGIQRRMRLALPGWDLELALARPPFDVLVRAVPLRAPISHEDVDRLMRQLFSLLSLIAVREVGVGPVCGLDAAGEIVWAQWISPRCRPGRAGARWCPNHLAASALPALAAGLVDVAGDPALETIVNRAVDHLLTANGDEVLDVRIPVACSGLELLAWAVLMRRDELTSTQIASLSAGNITQRLLEHAGIPPYLPDAFEALRRRRDRLSEHKDGPGILFHVRNKLVHPPRRIDSPEWPTADELFESWLLATWYLELAILRILDYSGDYWSRLRLGQQPRNLEAVPWAASDGLGGGRIYEPPHSIR